MGLDTAALSLVELCCRGTYLTDIEPVIYSPSEEMITQAQLTEFMSYCSTKLHRKFESQASFHNFSVTNFRVFWSLFLDWAGVKYDGSPLRVCQGDDIERLTSSLTCALIS